MVKFWVLSNYRWETRIWKHMDNSLPLE
jgi:hypothetical protein